VTRKQRRMGFVLAGMATLGVGAALVLMAFQDNLVFFYSPSDVLSKGVAEQRRIRLGGLVEPQSVRKEPDGVTTVFRVTDTAHALPVRFRGLLPDLFREGQGIVTEGSFGADGVFTATSVLAKHDETYMPKEVADALKKQGQWKPEKK
jgi:cytochrome c-type biogenesis protein CcmE